MCVRVHTSTAPSRCTGTLNSTFWACSGVCVCVCMCEPIFITLSQCGAWGCFDEFNRITIEVLSVVAQQILSILQAQASERTRFVFEGREINITSTCGIFITMVPGQSNILWLTNTCICVVVLYRLCWSYGTTWEPEEYIPSHLNGGPWL